MTDAGLDGRCVAELITHTLCGLHRCDGHFVQMKATLGDDGYIAVDVTRVHLDGDDAVVRVLLRLTGPVPVTSRSLTEGAPAWVQPEPANHLARNALTGQANESSSARHQG